jgi:hypothetical protein
MVTGPALVEYDGERGRAAERMDALGRGARRTCSFDLRLAPSVVSQVLNGRFIDPDVLARIVAWLDARPSTPE